MHGSEIEEHHEANLNLPCTDSPGSAIGTGSIKSRPEAPHRVAATRRDKQTYKTTPAKLEVSVHLVGFKSDERWP
jgi:hypothetical protein